MTEPTGGPQRSFEIKLGRQRERSVELAARLGVRLGQEQRHQRNEQPGDTAWRARPVCHGVVAGNQSPPQIG
jgi:hypothetical protein